MTATNWVCRSTMLCLMAPHKTPNYNSCIVTCVEQINFDCLDSSLPMKINDHSYTHKLMFKSWSSLGWHDPCLVQARRQDIAAGGAKNQKEGPKTRRGDTFYKYPIRCMQQPWGQTRNGRAQISNGGPGTSGPPAGDGPGLVPLLF